MNIEQQLSLQAYLDGELNAGEARQVEAALAADPSAQALLAELRQTQAVLRANEPVCPVPETREFYWSKIERAITRAEAREEQTVWWPSLWLAWRRALVPVAGLALVALLAVYTIQVGPGLTEDNSLVEIENPSDDTGSYSFRSQSENMFVVWVYNKETAPPDEPGADEELFYQ
jgi:anti-sigma factor RsiW